MWEIKNSLFISYKTSFLALTTTKFLINQIIKKDYKIKNLEGLSYPKIKSLYGIVDYLCLKKEKILLFCEQVHSNKVVFINKFNYFINKKIKINKISYEYLYLKGIDGILTNLQNAVIVVFTADCIPLFVYSELYGVFGLLHVGRKGLESGIVENMIDFIINKDYDILKFKFISGVHICEKHYIVDNKNYNLFEKVKNKLLSFGVKESQIFTSRFCTYCNNELFFSYRKEKTDLRLISLITTK